MPFGEALANGGGAITNDGNPLAFTGQYLDPVTGLYDLRARNYDPSVGRFTSVDPLGYRDAPEASPYGYARNDPTAGKDPSGKGAVGDHCWSLTCWLADPRSWRDMISAGGGCVVYAFGTINATAYLDFVPPLAAPNTASGVAGCFGGISVYYKDGWVGSPGTGPGSPAGIEPPDIPRPSGG
ncbi:MAG: RHS repeat-associated core domain-containing protein [Gaiellaceae bacterium]|jgi:RHS repeat-associated protein